MSEASAESSGAGGRREGEWVTYAFLSASLVAVHVALLLFLVPEVIGGTLFDPDSYTRLLRVAHLKETGGWFDSILPWMNAPYGLDFHWTRPLDLFLLGGALILTPAMGFDSALYWSGVLLSPALHVLACLGLAWAVKPLFGSKKAALVIIVVLAQPIVSGYALAGRADHHMLLILSYVLSLGFFIRFVLRPEARWAALASGALAGLGLWSSIEFLLPLTTLFGALCILWLAGFPKIERNGQLFSLGWAAVTLAALLSEHPLTTLLRPEYDRISAPHLLMALLAVAFWASLTMLRGRRPGGRSVGGRVVAFAVGAAASAGLLGLAYPGIFSNPIRAVEPEFWELYVQHFAEYQSFFIPGFSGLGYVLVYLGAALLALPFGLWMVSGRHRAEVRAAWAPVCLGLVAFIPLALAQLRFALWAGVVIAVALTGFLCRLNEKLNRIQDPLRRGVVRVSLNALALTGFMIAGIAIIGLAGEGSAPTAEVGGESVCSTSGLAKVLVTTAPGEAPRTILVNGNIGPELVYRTRHSVVAAPYHRNAGGVLDTHRAMTSPDLEGSRRIVQARGVDLVALCPAEDQAFFGGTSQDGESLFHRLVADRPPRWLEPIDAPGSRETGYLIFEVIDE